MKLLFITTLLIAFNIHAQIELEDCAIAGDHFGSQTSIPSSIPNECHQLLKNAKTTYNFHKSPDQLVSVIGSKNLLLTTLYKEDENKKLLIQKRHITSGENSKLTEILAVKTNQFDQKTYVLNQDKNNFSLYSYFYNSGGNNVPARKLISTEIFNATNFVIDNNAEEIYVISSIDGWIKVFNKDADPDGPRPNNSTIMKRSIKGINTQISNPIDIVISNNEIFVLDNDQVLVFNKNDIDNSPPKRIISGQNTQIKQAKYIILKDHIITVTNSDDIMLSFPETAAGNVSPL